MIHNIVTKLANQITKVRQLHRVNKNIARLKSLENAPVFGSADWLALCELEMGGIQKNVLRKKVSDYDPRNAKQLQTGGMIGGDRMIHHNYANIYEAYLRRFISRKSVVILECGILRGTGLAVWSCLFPSALIIGLDIDLSHTKSNLEYLKSKGAFKNSMPNLLVFDQFSPKTVELENILESQKLEIIIDDGYHSDTTILNTLYALKPYLSDEFVYFVEDNSTVFPKIKEQFPEFLVEPFGQMTVITSPNKIA